MTLRRKIIGASLILITCATLISLILIWTRPSRPYAAFSYVHPGPADSATQAAATHTFWVTNLSNNTIALANPWLALSAGTSWHRDTNWVFSEWVSTNLGPFQTTTITVVRNPAPGPWRLHIYVSSQAHGVSAFPAWLRYYSHPGNWAINRRFVGWKIWNWPPFGHSVITTCLYNNGFELISQEMDAKPP